MRLHKTRAIINFEIVVHGFLLCGMPVYGCNLVVPYLYICAVSKVRRVMREMKIFHSIRKLPRILLFVD